jgi:hypothetical protein
MKLKLTIHNCDRSKRPHQTAIYVRFGDEKDRIIVQGTYTVHGDISSRNQSLKESYVRRDLVPDQNSEDLGYVNESSMPATFCVYCTVYSSGHLTP